MASETSTEKLEGGEVRQEPNPGTEAIIGVRPQHIYELPSAIEQALTNGFGFVVVPLVQPRLKIGDLSQISSSRFQPFARSDLVLSSHQWSTLVVGEISKWINLDSPDKNVRAIGETALRQEISWAMHLNLPAVTLPQPHDDGVNYCRVLNSVLNKIRLKLWIHIPLVDRLDYSENSSNKTWETWVQLYQLCDYHTGLGVVLEITEDLPEQEIVERWIGEPVKAALLPTTIFKTNKKGYPVLSWRHQSLVLMLQRHKVQFIIKGRPRHEQGFRPYRQYIHHLLNKLPPLSTSERFCEPYNDYLQAPLQPLMDNLESTTYETFEKDPVKYRQYQMAIEQALRDLELSSPAIVIVVGAGRGPLVKAAINAEKNPNAIITLRDLQARNNWHEVMSVVHTDMRYWETEIKADILVSELLGSWGDNELSPECLDGAQRFLKPNGISIPYEYTSFVSPISTCKLWNDVSQMGGLKHFETIYVARLHNCFELAEPKPCFTFTHPNRDTVIDNQRFTQISYKVQTPAILHGFAGYFEAKLYKDIMISIRPETFSHGMFSWFPVYIPIHTPLHAAKGDSIIVNFWRLCTLNKVWYEWAITSPTTTPIHNVNGRSYSIGLLSE